MLATFGLGNADRLIQCGRPEAIKHGNTLVEDLYDGQSFDYVLSNPPFGKDWSADQKSVREQAQVHGSRFSHGLPSTTDGQMLFLAHCASKLSPADKNGQGGRAAVVSNASPLFASDRSEEHTSELQSLMRISYAVFCLKTKIHHQATTSPSRSSVTQRRR